jgi:TATA-binding protein-associated factor
MDLSLFLRPSGQTFGPAPPAPRQATPPSTDTSAPPAPKRRRKSEKKEEPQQNSHNVDAHVMQGDLDLVGIESLMKMKIAGAKAFGLAMSLWPKEGRVAFFQPRLQAKITSPYSTTQLVGCMVVEEYFRNCKDGYENNFITDLQQALDSERAASYRDHVPYLQIVRAQCHSLLNTFRDASRIQPLRIPQYPVVVQGDAGAGPDAFTIAHAESIVGETFNKLKRQLPSAAKLMSTQNLADAKQSAEDAIATAKAAKDLQDMRIRSAVASAFIAANYLPKKLGPVIKAAMESIKLEENLDLQKRSAASVASLISTCSASGRTGIAEKVTKNLCAFLCVDTSEVPEFHRNEQFTDNILSLRKEEDRKEHADQAQFERDAKAARIKRRGAKEALEHLVERFGNKLFEAVPTIRTSIIEPLHKVLGTPGEVPKTILEPADTLGQECVDALSILRALLSKFHQDLYPTVVELFPLIKEALQSQYSVLRYAAAKCFATICSVITIQGMTTLVEQILPMIQNAGDLRCRQGAVECVYRKSPIVQYNPIHSNTLPRFDPCYGHRYFAICCLPDRSYSWSNV